MEVQLHWIEALHPIKQRCNTQCVFINDIVVYRLVCLSHPLRKLLVLPEAQHSPAVHCCPHPSSSHVIGERRQQEKRGGCGTAAPVFTSASGRLLPLILRLSSEQKLFRQRVQAYFCLLRVSLKCFHMQSQDWLLFGRRVTKGSTQQQRILHVSWYPKSDVPVWPSDPFPLGTCFSFIPHMIQSLAIVPAWN